MNNLSPDDKREYEDLTFVTMLFNMRDSKEGHINLSGDGGDRHLERTYADFYVSSLQKLCDRYKNIVVFCDRECADILNATDAKIMVMRLDELPIFQEFDKLMGLFRRMGESVRQWPNMHVPLRGTDSNYADRALYASIVLSKIHILSLAAEIPEVQSKYLCWIDAGLESNQFYWKDCDDSKMIYPDEGRVRVCCSSNLNLGQTIYDIRHTSAKDAALCRRPLSISYRTLMALIGREIGPVPQVWGGVLSLETSQCKQFEEKYNKYLRHIVEQGFICYEQGVLTLMLSEHPGWFDVVFTDYNEMKQFFGANAMQLEDLVV